MRFRFPKSARHAWDIRCQKTRAHTFTLYGRIVVIGQPADADPNSPFIVDGYKVELNSGSQQFFYSDQHANALHAAKQWARQYITMLVQPRV